jgi:ABC-type branched-subunit amino acid transport system substrate-binding protein
MKKVYLSLFIGLIILCAVLFYRNLTNPKNVVLLGNFEEERYNFETNSIIAARIAEKDINDNGGIKGRKTKLIIKNDDFENPEETIKFLKEQKAEAVITTTTSGDLLKLKAYLDEEKIVCMSMGATASSLSKMNDYIYRLMPDDENEIKLLLNHLQESGMQEKIVVIYNQANLEYKKSVEANISRLGGKVVFEDTWNEDPIDYKPSNLEIMKDKPILILASARDTAFVSQKLSQQGISGMNFGLSWSADNNLNSYGGKTVEGFKFISPVDFTSKDGDYGRLAERLKGYKKSNGLIPCGVYEAYMLIKNAYDIKSDRHITLKEALDKGVGYNNTEEHKRFDEFGDSLGKEFIFTIKDGKFIKIGGSSNESS